MSDDDLRCGNCKRGSCWSCTGDSCPCCDPDICPCNLGAPGGTQ